MYLFVVEIYKENIFDVTQRDLVILRCHVLSSKAL